MARVLIGTDGSETARRAARRAMNLLGGGHDVTLVRVVQLTVPIAAMPAAGMAAIPVHDDVLDETNERIIQEAKAELTATAGDLGLSAEQRVVVGDPGPTLCELAADSGADVVVLGSHGSGFLKRVLLGSVSHYVLHHAPCPVLVVRQADDDQPEE